MDRLDAEIMSNPYPILPLVILPDLNFEVTCKFGFWSFDAYPIIVMVPGSHGKRVLGFSPDPPGTNINCSYCIKIIA